MNRNPKEKTVQILIRTKPKDKDKIKRLAEKCNLSISEYMVQRALGYEPRMIPPDTFYALYGKLCEVCNTEGIVPEMETKLLALIDEIHSELLLPNKESIKQIKNGIEVNKKGQPQASGLSKTG